LVVFALGLATAPYIGKAIMRPAEAATRVISDRTAVADIAEMAAPAVVGVTTYQTASKKKQLSPEEEEFFRKFFGMNPPAPDDKGNGDNGGKGKSDRQLGYASGFIFRPDGYILTNAHVVDGASKVEISLQGWSSPVQAKVIGQSSLLDLAVLKIDVKKDLPVLVLGDSGKLRPGEWVVAIGNPLGYDHTVTAGVISATGRRLRAGGDPVQGSHMYEDLIQTDAAINPGNSGGPLLDLDGRVIGINAVVSVIGQGIGFAIPINIARDAVDQLIKSGHYTRPWLGVSIIDLTMVDEQTRKKYQLPAGDGVFIAQVNEGTPAEGVFVVGDAIVSLDGKPIRNSEELIAAVRGHKVGDVVKVGIIHRGKNLEFELTLAEQPEE
jgi:S1-C subfamily serine protease